MQHEHCIGRHTAGVVAVGECGRGLSSRLRLNSTLMKFRRSPLDCSASDAHVQDNLHVRHHLSRPADACEDSGNPQDTFIDYCAP